MKNKLQNRSVIKCFVFVCWIAYFSTYLGRLNYIAAMNEMVGVGFLTKLEAGMMGVNTMLISLLPLHFANFGKVSTVTGILNSCAYAGSALSSFGIGLIAQSFSWEVVIGICFLIALAGGIMSFIAMTRWQNVSQERVLDGSGGL